MSGIRFGIDGLPRGLPISRAERRRLRALVHAARAKLPSRRSYLAALVPGLVMGATTLVWMPALWVWGIRVGMIVAAACLVLQCIVSLPLMYRLFWRDTCRAMAAAGYEVCPGCAFPLRDAPARQRVCPECGATRVAGAGAALG